MPEIAEEHPVDIEAGSSDYATKLQNAQEDGMILVKLEEAVVRDRISHDLYEKPSSGLRELFANEARACRTAKREHSASPVIEVTMNKLSRKLVIHGSDSMGIEQDLFVDVVRYLGRSNNFDGKETGQFGFGLASYTCLSDIMILETFSRITDEKYAVMGKGGVGFQILPKPVMDSYGTKITMTLKESIDMDELAVDLEKFAIFCGIDVYLIVDGETIRYRYDAGVHKLDGMTFEEKVNSDKFESYGSKILSETKVKIHGDGFDLYGRFVFRGRPNTNESTPQAANRVIDYSTQNVLLLGLPVDFKIEFPFSSYILNITNERKYKPTPDRERLTEDSSKRLLKAVNQALVEFFKKDEIKSVDDFTGHKHEFLYLNKNYYGIHDYLVDEVKDMLYFLETEIITSDDTRTTIGNVHKTGKLINVKSLRSIKVSVLKEKIPNAVIFRAIPYNNAESLRLVRNPQFGVINGDEYLKVNKIKCSESQDAARQVSVRFVEWEDRWGHHYPRKLVSEKIMSDGIGDFDIRVTKEQAESLHGIMHTAETRYRTILDKKFLKTGKTYDAFIDNAGTVEVETNNGKMTLEEATASGRRIFVTNDVDVDLLKQIDTDDVVIIMESDNEKLFNVIAFLKARETKADFDVPNYHSSAWDRLKMDKVLENRSCSGFGSVVHNLDTLVVLRIYVGNKMIADDDVWEMFISVAMKSRDCDVAKFLKFAERFERKITMLQNQSMA